MLNTYTKVIHVTVLTLIPLFISQRISYRSNWFNLMIYGNCVHIVGYMMVSAWVSAILNKFGVKKY